MLSMCRKTLALQYPVDVAAPWLQALTGPPTQDSIEDTSGCCYDYLLSMPIQNLTIEKVCACTDWDDMLYILASQPAQFCGQHA